LQEFGKLGVRAIMFAGEGEPLLHTDICELAECTKNAGIDVSFTTNAVLLDAKKVARLLPVSSWIKVSCNAGDAESYAKIHGTKAQDYDTVLRNMAYAVEFRKKEQLACTLGFQCILLPESQDSMVEHARRVRNLGADYLVIKPYTHHPQSLKEERELIYDYSDELALGLKALESTTFKVIYRNNTMQRWNTKKASFNVCHALPFWSFIDSEGNVWGCSRHLLEDNFNYGNLYEQSFAEIWNSDKRKQSMDWCNKNLNINECHLTCRMEAINEYLHRLKNPMSHDNFI